MMYVRPVHGAVALLVSLGLTAAACAGPSRPPVAAVTAPPTTSDTPSPSPTPEPPTPTPDPPTPVVAPPPPPAPAPPPPVAPPPPPPRTIMPPAFNDRDRDNFGGPNDFDGNG